MHTLDDCAAIYAAAVLQKTKRRRNFRRRRLRPCRRRPPNDPLPTSSSSMMISHLCLMLPNWVSFVRMCVGNCGVVFVRRTKQGRAKLGNPATASARITSVSRNESTHCKARHKLDEHGTHLVVTVNNCVRVSGVHSHTNTCVTTFRKINQIHIRKTAVTAHKSIFRYFYSHIVV